MPWCIRFSHLQHIHISSRLHHVLIVDSLLQCVMPWQSFSLVKKLLLRDPPQMDGFVWFGTIKPYLCLYFSAFRYDGSRGVLTSTHLLLSHPVVTRRGFSTVLIEGLLKICPHHSIIIYHNVICNMQVILLEYKYTRTRSTSTIQWYSIY